MPEDPYITYLKLPAGPRPPKAHVLLGVEPDVNDPSIIESAAQRKMDELDQYALSSDKATRDQVQKLMSEVAKARVKLVKRAEAKVKKTPPVAPPVTPVVAQEAPAAPVTAPKPAAAQPKPTPAPVAVKEPRPKGPWFAWPSLSAEAWALLGVTWLMSLTATAVGAYFIASNQTLPGPVEIAGNNPATAPDNAGPSDEPGSDPATPADEQTDPETNPDQQTPPETDPANEAEANPQDNPQDNPQPEPRPQTPEGIAAATMDTVMQIDDRDDRLKAYLLARDALAIHSRDQHALIIEATRRFNGEDDLEIDLKWHGNRYRVSAAILDGIKDHPNLKLTDLSSFNGLPIASLNLQNCRGIKDLSTLGRMDLTTLEIAGCVGIKDLTQLNRFQSIESLIVGGSSLTSLDGLSLRNLRRLRIVESPITDLSPLSKMELESLYLVNCYRLTTLEAMEAMPPLQVFRLIDEPDRRLSSEYSRVESIRPSVTARYTAAQTSSVWPRAEGPSLPEPEVVAEHIAEHNKLDKIQYAPDRQKAFIRLRDTYKPFSQEQTDLIEREIKHLNDLDRLHFAMEGDPVEPRVIVGFIDNAAGSQNHLITDLSPLTGISTHTLAVQHLRNLRDFTFLNGATVDTLKLTGCTQFKDVSIFKDVKGLAALDIGNTAVSDLQPLQLKSLSSLILDGCKGLTDLDGLQGMELETLSAADCTAIREVSALARVSGLKYLSLDNTSIQSVSPLTRQRELMSLSLNGCKKLATVSGLYLLRNLKTLQLYDTALLFQEDIDRLKTRMPNTKIQSKRDEVAAQPDDAPNQPGDAQPPAEQNAQTVKNIRELMKIKSGEERLKAYFKLRDSLEPYSDEQRDLVQWAFFQSNVPDKMESCVGTYSDSFNLYYRTYRADDRAHTVDYITDLSAFTGLKFTTLDLDRATNLRDFSPIGTMSIMRLDLSRTRLTDLKQIEGVKDLVQLDLSETGIRNLNSLEAEELGRLDLEKCPRLTSLDGLEGKTIDTLSANGSANLSDFSALSEIKGLENLTLTGTRIGSLKVLEGLDDLEYLNLMECKNLSSLGTLTKLKSLKSVYLYRTNLPERDLRALQSAMPNARIAY